jgi:hypothetical protein
VGGVIFASLGDGPTAQQTGKGDKSSVEDGNQEDKGRNGYQGENI